MGQESPQNENNKQLMGAQPTITSFCAESFNFHLYKYTDTNRCIIFGPTKKHICPPVSEDELKGLANFILKHLENNQ